MLIVHILSLLYLRLGFSAFPIYLKTVKHYIYIPGLGDHFDFLRKLILRIWWQNANTRVTFVPMRWADRHETYEAKYQRVAAAIKAVDNKVILVGESAGGAMTMFALSRHPKEIDHVVTICGYNHDADAVHLEHKTRHPAFYRIMPAVDAIVVQLSKEERARITTIYSTKDTIVIPEHSRIEGAQATVLHTSGHLLNIARALLGRYPLKLTSTKK